MIDRSDYYRQLSKAVERSPVTARLLVRTNAVKQLSPEPSAGKENPDTLILSPGRISNDSKIRK